MKFLKTSKDESNSSRKIWQGLDYRIKYLLVCSIVDLKVLRVIIILNSVTEYIQMGTLMH